MKVVVLSLPLACPSCVAQIGELRSRQLSGQLGRKAQDCWEPCHPRCCRRLSSWPDCYNKVSTMEHSAGTHQAGVESWESCRTIRYGNRGLLTSRD